MTRIAVVTNKSWEADPLCSLLVNDRAHAVGAFTNFVFKRFPGPRPLLDAPHPAAVLEPRLTFACAGASVEVWCLEEHLAASQSSISDAKATIIPSLLAGTLPDLVIAFGTAASAPDKLLNGCVVVGTSVFMHNAWEGRTGGPSSLWIPPKGVRTSSYNLQNAKLDKTARFTAEAHFVLPPLKPACPPVVLMGDGYVSLGTVNIGFDYDNYVWADPLTLQAFFDTKYPGEVGCIETTHGIIVSATTAPFLFFSGIANAMGCLNEEVAPREYAQNTAAANNAAVALAWLLPSIITNLVNATRSTQHSP